MSRTLPEHMRQGGTRDVPEPDELPLDLLSEFRVAEFLDRTDMTVASIVEHHIDPAEMRHSLTDRFLRRRRIGDVQTQCQGALASAVRQSTNGVNIASRDH